MIVQYQSEHQASSCVENMRDRLFDGRTVRAHVLSPLPSTFPPPPPILDSQPPPPLPSVDYSVPSMLTSDLDPLDPSVVEAVQDVEDFLNSLL